MRVEVLTALFLQCSALNKMLRGAQLQHVMKATGFNPEDGENDLKPDLCLYPVSGDAPGIYNDVKNINVPPDTARAAWAFITTLIEIKTNPNAAPFNFDDEPFTLNTDDKLDDAGPKSRAQMASYATELQRRQHRNFVFTAFIQQDRVRFMRWDRTGTLVSPTYNYKQDPEWLLRFIYLISTSSPEGQGYETAFHSSVGRITSEFRKYKASLQKDEDKRWYRKLGEGLGMNNRTTALNPLHEVTLCSHLA